MRVSVCVSVCACALVPFQFCLLSVWLLSWWTHHAPYGHLSIFKRPTHWTCFGFGWFCHGFVDPFSNAGACSRSINYGCESGVEVPPEPAVRKLQQQHKHNIFYKYIKRKIKKKKEETKGFDKQSATKDKYGPYCHALYSQLDGRSLRTSSWLGGKWLWVMGYTAWTCAHERKKKLFKRK